MDIGFPAFQERLEVGIMFGWPIQRSDGGDCGMHMRSQGFVRSPRCMACSVIRKRVSSPSNGAQKNDLQLLRSSALGLVRPTHAARSRSVVWRHAHLSGDRGASCALQELRAREARAARLPGGQPFLYQALCLLRWAALSSGHHQGRCRGTQASLGDDQDSGDPVHARATGPCGHPRPQSHRHRRDLDPQGPYLPHRGQRPASRAPGLVWWSRSQRGEHGAVLRLAGREEHPGHSLGGDGHVEGVSQRDCGVHRRRRSCTTSSTSCAI